MSGRSGQLLTSTFYDDCENIVMYSGYPVLKVDKSMFEAGNSVSFSSFEDASNRLGLSVAVLKDLTRLANVKLLEVSSQAGQSRENVLPVKASYRTSTSYSVSSNVSFGADTVGTYTMRVNYNPTGAFTSGVITFTPLD